MPRDAQATLEDGTVVQYNGIPDNVTPDEFIARVKKDTGKEVTSVDGKAGAKQATAGEAILGVPKSVLRGFANSAAATAEGLANAHDLEAGNPYDPSQYSGAGAAVRSALPAPNDAGAARYIRKAAEGVGGALTAPPGGGIPRTLVGGGLAGLGGQAGSDLTQGNPLGEILGNIFGASAGGISALVKKNAPLLAAETLDGVSSPDLAAAVERMAKARSLGIPVNLSQAMDRPSNIDDIVRQLASSKNGQEIIAQLRAQPGQVQAGANAQVARLPGHQLTVQQADDAAQAGATSVIKNAQRAAGALAAVPPGTNAGIMRVIQFDKALEDFANAHPNTDAASMAQNVRAQLQLPPVPGSPAVPASPLGRGLVSKDVVVPGAPATPPTPQYLIDAGKLKAAIDDAIQNFGSNRLNSGAAAKDLNRYATQIRAIRDEVLFPPGTPVSTAKNLAAGAFSQTVDPLEKSVVGRVAGVQGAQADKEAPAKLVAILSRGTPVGANGRPLAQSEILTLQRTLAQEDPAVFTNAVKTYLGDTLSKLDLTNPGRSSTDIAKQLSDALAGTPSKAQGLKDMLAGVARSQGVAEKPLVDGFMNFMKIAGMAANRPNLVSAAGEAAAVAGANPGVSLLQSLTPGRLGNKIQQSLSADAYKTMDKLLTTPEGVALLQELAKKSVMSPQSANAVGAFFGSLGSDSSEK